MGGTPSFEDSDGTTINSELGPAGAVEMPEITPFGGPSDVSTRRRSSTPAAPTGAFGPLPGRAWRLREQQSACRVERWSGDPGQWVDIFRGLRTRALAVSLLLNGMPTLVIVALKT